MKISYNWLKTIINVDLKHEQVADLLTDSGLEVEAVETFQSIKGGLQGLVIGEILTCEKHPDADRLKLTTVNVGNETPLHIVCGASNAAAGQKIVVATVGSILYTSNGETLEIKKSKIRGALSEGMICAEDEIGLGASHAGIMVLPDSTKPGTPASEYFKIESDVIFEIGLTPNRGDATSHYGVARELAAILNVQGGNKIYSAKLPAFASLPKATGKNIVNIEIKNADACKRYSGMVLSGISVGESPDWLKNRLLAIGLRPINNIVDITNYVLHETGQPLHAFDLDKITGNKIVVDNARAGEKFKTLDGIERELKHDDLMIRNAEHPMCLAGIFGGEISGVTNSTKSVFLESAWFHSDYIRRSSKVHGLKTDASFRFERGTDPEMVVKALQRAAQLIIEWAGGSLDMDVTDVYPQKLEPVKVAFDFNYCNELAGKNIEKTKIKSILKELGIEIEKEGNDGLLLSIPRYKSDVTRAADVAEEVMRIYGYNNIEPSKTINFTAYHEDKNTARIVEQKVVSALIPQGFSEMMNLSLTKDAYYDEKEMLVYVQNPLSSDLNIMRPDMLYCGLETINYNVNRRQLDLKLFEIGRVYKKGSNPSDYLEERVLSLFSTGNAFTENHYGLNSPADFNFLKAAVEQVLKTCGIIDYDAEPAQDKNLAYGLQISVKNKKLAQLGLIAKSLQKAVDLKQAVCFATIHLEILEQIVKSQKLQYTDLPVFPEVRRDLALILNKEVNYKDLHQAAFSAERKLLKKVNLFDVYEGEKLAGKKSYALSFILQSAEATLTDKQIESVMDKLLKTYKEKFGAELRN